MSKERFSRKTGLCLGETSFDVAVVLQLSLLIKPQLLFLNISAQNKREMLKD